MLTRLEAPVIGYVTLALTIWLVAWISTTRSLRRRASSAWAGARPSSPGARPGARRASGGTKPRGDGVMVALEAKDRAQVDRLHALALAHGGTDEGIPGERWPGS